MYEGSNQTVIKHLKSEHPEAYKAPRTPLSDRYGGSGKVGGALRKQRSFAGRCCWRGCWGGQELPRLDLEKIVRKLG